MPPISSWGVFNVPHREGKLSQVDKGLPGQARIERLDKQARPVEVTIEDPWAVRRGAELLQGFEVKLFEFMQWLG